MARSIAESRSKISLPGLIRTVNSIGNLGEMGIFITKGQTQREIEIVHRENGQNDFKIVDLSIQTMRELHTKYKKGPDYRMNLEDEVALFVMTNFGVRLFPMCSIWEDEKEYSAKIEERINLIDGWISKRVIRNSIAAWCLAHIALGVKSNVLDTKLRKGERDLLTETMKTSKQWVYLINPPNREWIERWFLMAKDRKTFSSFFDPILFVDVD